MKRAEAIEIILKKLDKNDYLVSTTGMISREVFAIDDRPQNFYMLGSMGLVSPLVLGIALNKKDKKIIALEGDGSLLLNLGAVPLIAFEKVKNLIQIVLDNGVYQSTGSQPTISAKIDLSKITKASGFKNVARVGTKSDLNKVLSNLLAKAGPNFLLIKVEDSAIPGIPRISHSPEEIKENFMRVLNE